MAGTCNLDDTGDRFRPVCVADPAELRSRLIKSVFPAQLLELILTGFSDSLEWSMHTVGTVDQIGEGDALEASSGIVLGIFVIRRLNNILDFTIVDTGLLAAAAGAVRRARGSYILQLTFFRLFIRRGMGRQFYSTSCGNGTGRFRNLEKFSSGKFQFFIHSCTLPCKISGFPFLKNVLYKNYRLTSSPLIMQASSYRPAAAPYRPAAVYVVIRAAICPASPPMYGTEKSAKRCKTICGQGYSHYSL